ADCRGTVKRYISAHRCAAADGGRSIEVLCSTSGALDSDVFTFSGIEIRFIVVTVNNRSTRINENTSPDCSVFHAHRRERFRMSYQITVLIVVTNVARSMRASLYSQIDDTVFARSLSIDPQ